MEEPLTKKAKKKAKKEQLKNVELLAEKQTYFGDEQTGDADTWWLKAKIPSGANRIRLDYHPIGKKDERVSQVYPNVQHRQVDGWVGLRVTGLASTADTGYNFFAYENDESDSFGECIRSKRKADAPAPAPPPPLPPLLPVASPALMRVRCNSAISSCLTAWSLSTSAADVEPEAPLLNASPRGEDLPPLPLPVPPPPLAPLPALACAAVVLALSSSCRARCS